MSDHDIIRHCAPTLAGIKTGSLFTCAYESKDTLNRSLQQINHRLGSKGLRAIPLRFSEERALIYLYRPKSLSKDLSDSIAAELLQQYGYRPARCGECVVRLAQKLRQEHDFPHEIGLFLGYPPEDVRGFIDNNACSCKCVGYWKVYGDEEAARKKFAQYKKCTQVYCDRWAKGADIERLTVTG